MARSSRYCLRMLERADYRRLADVEVPRTSTTTTPQASDELYPVEIVERDESRGLVRVHYTGFSRQYDEWKEAGEIVPLNEKGELNKLPCTAATY